MERLTNNFGGPPVQDVNVEEWLTSNLKSFLKVPNVDQIVNHMLSLETDEEIQKYVKVCV